jgi:hypothetical protein
MQKSEKKKRKICYSFPVFHHIQPFYKLLYVFCHKLNIDYLNVDDEKYFCLLQYSALKGGTLQKDQIEMSEVKRVNDLNFVVYSNEIVRYLWKRFEKK